MKIQFLGALLCLFMADFVMAQTATIDGQIVDATTREPLIGATISTNDGNGTITDFDGQFKLVIPHGTHTLTFSYISYDPQSMELVVTGDMSLDIKLESENLLNEVVVTADIAIERETPVAFTNIPTKKLDEELASQDIPMILNSTPGAYATETGGGDGDARITIRGFNQRNIAVMLDGIPVNDMENGWVYWSNWFGLDLVTQTMQVQRGLGASKLSIPSIGGTVNILTKGIDAKRGLRFKQEIGNNGFLRSTIGVTSGRLSNGFGISAAASYKQGDGWVDGNFTKGYFYYLRIDKQLGSHLISLSGFGAPQQHGQRPFSYETGLVDTVFALENGVPQSAIDELLVVHQGRRYNQHWGYKDGKLFNTRKNYYHKPQISLRHSWQANNRLFWSNIAYLSIGTGGGTAPTGDEIPRSESGEYDIDAAIAANQETTFSNPNGESNTIIRSSNNDHFWYGLLSTANYKLSPVFTLAGGIDARYYRGDHYRSVYDLLGGTGYLEPENNEQVDPTIPLQEGGKLEYDNSGFVRWGGAFALLEFKKDKLTAFANVSGAVSGYSMVDYMKPKIVELGDTSLLVSYTDTIEYKGQTYTLGSAEAKDQRVDWINIPSYTFKVGASYNFDQHHNVFFNSGYLSKAQRFNNVINNNRFGEELLVFNEYDNEKIIAFELGYGFKSRIFSANLNTYYTIWENKPLDSPPTAQLDNTDPESDRIAINISGIDALHQGIELDFAFEPIKEIGIEGLVSIGDWRWTSAETGVVQLPNNVYMFDFDATDVRVGDAAQLQFGGLIRYEPIKSLYFKLKGTYFAKNYANFQPEDLEDENAGRQSWKMPNYTLFSFHMGYYFKVKNVGLNLRANVLNLLDEVYISDARNNDRFNSPQYSDFDAKSASVHYGQGRRYTLSLQISL